MKTNEHIALSTSKLLLVPYETHHVPTYHTWMQDQALQTATASEPLTLDEEHSMQQSWRTDHDKLTFIICLPLTRASTSRQGRDDDATGIAKPSKYDSSDRMIGDINLFLYDLEEDEDDDDTNLSPNDPTQNRGLIGEIELMIARKDLQNQGYGRAALLTFITYVLSSWQEISREYYAALQHRQPEPPRRLAYLRAKIHQSNERSIRLFSSVGFRRVGGGGANYFGEVELRWRGDVEDLERLEWAERACVLQYR